MDQLVDRKVSRRLTVCNGGDCFEKYAEISVMSCSVRPFTKFGMMAFLRSP